MAELLPCPFCGGEAFVEEHKFHGCSNTYGVKCSKCHTQTFQFFDTKEIAEKRWNTRTQKEIEAEKPKVTCLNCKHLMFSDMYGECNKQLRIVHPSDTCEYAESKERGDD